MDRDRAPRRHRLAGDDHPGARGYRRLGRRSAAGGDASGGRRPMARRATITPFLPGWPSGSALPRRSPRAGRRASGSSTSTSRPVARLLARGVDAPDFDEFWEAGELILPILPWDGGIVRDVSPRPRRRRRCRRRAAGSRSPRRRSPVSAMPIAPAIRPGCRPPRAPESPAARASRCSLIANQPATRLHSQLDFGATSQAVEGQRARAGPHPSAGRRGARHRRRRHRAALQRSRRLPRRRGA